MIKVEIDKSKIAKNPNVTDIKRISVTGHAKTKDQLEGSGEICAAVSTAIILTVNLLKIMKIDHLVSYEVRAGYFEIIVKDNIKIVKLFNILENLEYTLTDLQKSHPLYIDEICIIVSDPELIENIKNRR